MPKGVIFIVLAATVIVPLCTGLRGQAGSVCTYETSRTASRKVSYWKTYKGGMWWWEKTYYRQDWGWETYTAWDEHDKCCSGYRISYSETPLDAATNWCVPVCVKPCNFGTCTAPEFCTCDHGYTKIENSNSCEPKCTDGCISGTCIAPETCKCHVGYEKSLWSNNVCIPVCNETCVFGKCIAPNTCVCDVGYAMISQVSNVCEPVCTNDCLHGTCVRPNDCECDQGFFKDERTSGPCIPICEPSCIHGRCTIGGCSCFFGWDGASCNESRYCLLGDPPELTADGKQIASMASPLDQTATTGTGSTKSYAYEDYQGTSEPPSQFFIFENYETSPDKMSEVVFTVDSESTVSIEVGFSEDRRIQWTGPACNPKCLNAVGQHSVYSGNTSMNATYWFFLTDTPCNIADAGLKLSTIPGIKLSTMLGMIFAITGVLLFGIITVVLIIYRRKKKRSIISGGTQAAILEESRPDEKKNVCIGAIYTNELPPGEIHKLDKNCDSCNVQAHGNVYETILGGRVPASTEWDENYEICP